MDPRRVASLLRAELGIHFAPPIPGSAWLCGRLADESLVGLRFSGERALEQAVEQQSAMPCPSTVEAEGEPVKVVVELRVADRTLVRAEHPALHERGDEVDVRKRDVRWVAGGRDIVDDVGEAVAADIEVALPTVGADLAAAGDMVEHELGERVLGDVGDPSDPDPLRCSVALNRDDDDRLARELPAADPAATAASTDIAFIDLNDAREQLTAREDHRASELVQPRPRRLIAPQPEDPLQAQRGNALLLVHDIPDRREPAHQRRASPGEDRPGRDRALRPANPAAS